MAECLRSTGTASRSITRSPATVSLCCCRTGTRATGRMFASAVAALARTHRCITWDLRGHGQSDYPEEQESLSAELALGDMLALLDVVEVDRAVLDRAARWRLSVAAMQGVHPERVAGLVLVVTGPGYRSDEGRRGGTIVRIVWQSRSRPRLRWPASRQRGMRANVASERRRPGAAAAGPSRA